MPEGLVRAGVQVVDDRVGDVVVNVWESDAGGRPGDEVRVGA